MNRIYYADNLGVLKGLEDSSVGLVYIDPPFNTGKKQTRTRIKTVHSEVGDRTGFQGRRYKTIEVGTMAFADVFDDYIAFLEPRLREVHRVLSDSGTLYLHVDYREVHYCKILLDVVSGRAASLTKSSGPMTLGDEPRRDGRPSTTTSWYT